jgi:hypothetical protein
MRDLGRLTWDVMLSSFGCVGGLWDERKRRKERDFGCLKYIHYVFGWWFWFYMLYA